jgi:F0F1-type ATP synthase delta subunit
MSTADAKDYATKLTDIARQLNLYISSFKGQRSGEVTVAKTLKENPVDYLVSRLPENFPESLFDETDFAWLES